MPRNWDSQLQAAFSGANLCPVIFGSFAFRSKTEYAWSGVGTYVWNGMPFKGVGSFGKVGDIVESGESNFQGTSVQLSGIDPDWLNEALTDIRLGGAARLWIADIDPQTGQLIGQPYMFFRGQIDKAPVSIDRETAVITLNLETRGINHARPNARRYTDADQRANGYPTDSAFIFEPQLSDQALIWGD